MQANSDRHKTADAQLRPKTVPIHQKLFRFDLDMIASATTLRQVPQNYNNTNYLSRCGSIMIDRTDGLDYICT